MSASPGTGLEELSFFIGGEFVSSRGDSLIESVNPYTGRAWATVPSGTQADVDRAVRAARDAFEGPWGAMTGTARAGIMRRFSQLIVANSDMLGRVESTDNGKLLKETTGVTHNLARWLDYFSGAAERLTGQTIPAGNPNYLAYTQRVPIGVVGAVVPWNAPMMLLMMKVAPALAAGCTLVVKTAEQTTASALQLARLAQEAGLPPGVLNIITGEGSTTGRALVSHPGIDKVSFTGSTAAGIRVMQDAATHLAPVTLELGGKSANLVFEDADIEAAINGVVASVFAATGQMCIAASRLYVHHSILDDFVSRLVQRAAEIRLGDPMSPESDIGPLATKEQLVRVLSMIDEAQVEGAELATGGRRPDTPGLKDGFFITPTIFTNVDPSMRIAREEIFGPVLAVFPFSTEAEAVQLANSTPYGLAGGIWTQNLQRAHRVAAGLRAGTVWINCYRVVDPAVPFGGMGASGFGRENGDEAVVSYTQTKSVWVELSGNTRDPFKMG